ncbi:MAG TPA: hypothetical protein VFM88_23825 [Vicinamibacteria bacterium]|nr:hypothetical protein [Vicinamibacteria bacterium]
MPSKLRTASTVVLGLAGGLVLVVSLLSANLAYRGEYQIGGATNVQDVAPGRPEIEVALRAIRGTSAAYAAGFAALFLAIALGPYRRGDVWAWWALLAGTLAILAIVLVRVPLLGVWLGAPPVFILTGVVVLGLLLDVKRLRG